MSKKKLLEEGTVRRFMKLAGTEALTSSVLKEQDEPVAEAPPGLGADEPDLPDIDALELEPEEELEEPEEELEEPEGEVEDAVRAMVDAIADVAADFGVDVDVETEEAPEIEVGAEPEPEEELELGGEEGEITGELGGEEPLQEQDDAPLKPLPKPGSRVVPVWNVKNLSEEDQRLFRECVKTAASQGGGTLEKERKTCACMKQYTAGQPDGHTLPEDMCPKSAFGESLENIDYVDENAIMNEVFHRVKNRLLKEKRADDMSSVLAKRIMKRLGKKLR